MPSVNIHPLVSYRFQVLGLIHRGHVLPHMQRLLAAESDWL